MSPNDERHGTPAGFRAHQRDREQPCKECREAKAAQRREKRAAASKTSARILAPYADSGYDPRDGLTGGAWVYDRRRGVSVWVEGAA